ncbi:MAG: type II secretion system F family protein [Tissierellia bacterium]|nr:type II secretion system F family protein [Tissierellia bacterium]
MNFSKIRKGLEKEIISKKLNARINSLFLKQLSVLLKSDISIDKALNVIYNGHLDKKLDQSLKRVLNKIEEGKNVYESFENEQKRFGDILIAFIQSGQESGNLAEIINDLSDFIKEEYENENKIRQAFVYPIILMCVTFFVIVLILKFVMPNFIEIFDSMDQQLPTITLILLQISKFVRMYGVMIFIMLVLILIAIKILKYKEEIRFKFDKFYFFFPLFKKYRLTKIEYQISKLMHILVKGEVEILTAMDIIKKSFKNTYLKEKLFDISKKLEEGYDISESFRQQKIFSNLLISMIEVGENTGNLSDTLKKSAEYFSSEYLFRLKKLSEIMEPLLIIIMSVIVGFIIFSIALPMFDSINALNY